MKTNIRFFIRNHYPTIMIVVFVLISALCLVFTSDDFVWYFVYENEDLKNYRMPNGRYLTNVIVYFLVKSTLFRTVFYTCVLSGMIILMSKIACIGQKNFNKNYLLTFFLFLMIPPETYGEVINWISGFPNYVFSFFLTSVYILFLFNYLFKENKINNYYAPLFFVLGLGSSLCVEHITIYNCFLSVFSIVIILLKKKKVSFHSICYLLGTIIGTLLMFTNPVYNNIGGEGDELGNRSFHFSFADIYYNVFKFIVVNYSKKLWVINAIIILSLTFFIRKKSTKGHKYSKVCSFIIWCYGIYSFFISCLSDLKSTSYSMKFEALELAFAFLYVVSLLYLFYSYLNKECFFRCSFYLISTVLLTAPFAFISPVTPRCMFADYMFWIMLAVELSVSIFDSIEINTVKMIIKVLTFCTIGTSVGISCMNITNKYYDVKRSEFLCQQVNNGMKHLQFVELPYDKYTWDEYTSDTLFDKVLDGDFSYGQLIFMYYGIDEGIDFDNISYNTITTSDYNLYISE